MTVKEVFGYEVWVNGQEKNNCLFKEDADIVAQKYIDDGYFEVEVTKVIYKTEV